MRKKAKKKHFKNSQQEKSWGVDQSVKVTLTSADCFLPPFCFAKQNIKTFVLSSTSLPLSHTIISVAAYKEKAPLSLSLSLLYSALPFTVNTKQGGQRRNISDCHQVR